MLKTFILLLLSTSLWAVTEEHATISLQRWNNKVVVTIDHEKGWHTYWKNPGDAGLPSIFDFTPKLKAHEWPVPQSHTEAGNILTIGYSGRDHFFFDDVPGKLEAHIKVLICKDVCIPGEAKLKLDPSQSFTSTRPAQAFSESDLKTAFDKLPKESSFPTGFEFYLTRTKDQNILTLHYSLKGLKNFKLPHELLFLTPFPHAPFGFKRETLFTKGDTLYGKTEIEWDGEYQEPPVALPANGSFSNAYELKFLLNAGHIQVISIPIKDFTNTSPTLDQFYKDLTPYNKTSTKAVSAGKSEGLFYYLALAFLGGLILNLMPCVLPVISIKLFGLIKHKEYSQKQILKHNLSYTAGVVFTFMCLASIISILKMTGEQVGWGFQLQSPTFILIMMLILFVLSLNMFGLYEFVTPGGQKFGSTQVKDNLSGDFFSGILTTILSTPCSAPFLGTALTFAFTTSYFTIFIMFLFIGLGLAFPFLLTALFPKSLSVFPRPGAWMEKLKYFLGLSLIATVVWLYDVFVSLVDFDKISWKLNLLFALWFFAFFFAKKISHKRFWQVLFFALPFAMTALAIQNVEVKSSANVSSSPSSEWVSWSENKLSENKGQLIFMDFTAEWCLTCKVNKKLVLETDAFKALKEKYNVTLMRADWTKRDDNITRFLNAHHAVGVPAYFVQKPDGTIVELGETITISKIEEHLK